MAEYIKKANIGLTDFDIALCKGDYKEALKMLLDKIESLPAADVVEREKGEWIPVTERLPEDGVPVLACYIGYNSGLLRTDLLVCKHEDEWCYWHGETCSYNTCKVIITHWMPLPEPPKGET